MNSIIRFLAGFVLIVLFYFAGELLVSLLDVPFPGTLVGLLLLLVFLFQRKQVPSLIVAGATPLLKYMTLFFVPAVLGVGVYWEDIASSFTAIFIAIVFTTVFSLGISAWIAQKLMAPVVSKDSE
ncbi:CidA/LrgA family protein [Alteromonas sp. C1M14]|uniref:CidA/LrgA family protein n=1 Tax=Alteromonas sp. C1M14 TaxID=2841567 RepID=UPI001C08CF81|nr:CidA/LrgA family protein [Alteromonas sp. C1M14]MBU2977789.1 CidA/LrgA family protein [Alteromonas sp. C1M14]